MARVDPDIISRQEVSKIVREAQNTGKNKKAHVKDELSRRYPELRNTKIVRNRRVYNVLDYIAEDADSYGGP